MLALRLGHLVHAQPCGKRRPGYALGLIRKEEFSLKGPLSRNTERNGDWTANAPDCMCTYNSTSWAFPSVAPMSKWRYVKGIDCRTQSPGYVMMQAREAEMGANIMAEGRTSIGLKNVAVSPTGPIWKLKPVRVAVTNAPVKFVWLAKGSCPKIECVTPSIRIKAVRPAN